MTTVTRRQVTWEVEEPESANGFWHKQWEKGWEAETLRVMDRFVKPGTIFVDIGAWIGPLSLWAIHLGAEVVALEPDPIAFDYLHENLRANRGEIPPLPLKCAIANHTGTCYIAPQIDYGWGSSMTYVTQRVGEAAKCMTLPDLFESFNLENVSLVKMDIEGGEVQALPTAAPFLAKRGIPLYLEMHHELGKVLPAARGWLSEFSRIQGRVAGHGHLLARP